MQNNVFYPIALLTVIGIGLYFVFGDFFSVKNVDWEKYREVCQEYLHAEQGKHTEAQMQSLVNKVNYLLPGEQSTITVPVQREVKSCTMELSKRLPN